MTAITKIVKIDTFPPRDRLPNSPKLSPTIGWVLSPFNFNTFDGEWPCSPIFQGRITAGELVSEGYFYVTVRAKHSQGIYGYDWHTIYLPGPI